MRETLTKFYDANHRSLIVDRSVVRYADTLWMFHGAWMDKETGKTKVLLSALHGGKMRLVHNRHLKQIELEYTIKD